MSDPIFELPIAPRPKHAVEPDLPPQTRTRRRETIVVMQPSLLDVVNVSPLLKSKNFTGDSRTFVEEVITAASGDPAKAIVLAYLLGLKQAERG